MVINRSVPADTVLPHITYRNVAEASRWLTDTFGFEEHYRYGPPDAPSGAQMHLGDAWIMLDTADPGEKTPAELGYGTQSLTIFVPDVDAHYQKVKSTGSTIVEELHETIYGERQYGVVDPDGHHWLFSTHAQDVDPAAWGATKATRPLSSGASGVLVLGHGQWRAAARGDHAAARDHLDLRRGGPAHPVLG